MRQTESPYYQISLKPMQTSSEIQEGVNFQFNLTETSVNLHSSVLTSANKVFFWSFEICGQKRGIEQLIMSLR